MLYNCFCVQNSSIVVVYTISIVVYNYITQCCNHKLLLFFLKSNFIFILYFILTFSATTITTTISTIITASCTTAVYLICLLCIYTLNGYNYISRSSNSSNNCNISSSSSIYMFFTLPSVLPYQRLYEYCLCL